MDTTDIIAIVATFINVLIAIIMAISAYFVYLSIKKSETINKCILFNDLIKQERELSMILFNLGEKIEYESSIPYTNKKTDLEKRYESLVFNFYEYISMGIIKRIINKKLFDEYFANKLGGIYKMFMESQFFNNDAHRRESYSNLVRVFNKYGLNCTTEGYERYKAERIIRL